MARTIQHKGGSTGQNDAYTGPARELTVDTTKHTLRVHDGVTPGGHEIPRSYSLDGVTDVTITSLTAGDLLQYNGTAWVNIGSAIGGLPKRVLSANIAASSGTTQITPGITPPLVTQGTQLWSYTVTPLLVGSKFLVHATVSASASTNNANLTMAAFRDGTYIGATVQIANSGNNSATLCVALVDFPNTTSPVTYQVRIGTSTGTWYANRRSNEVTYGGLNNGWVLTEY